MKVLVCGADGYIGILLAATLVERGHDVSGLDTGFYNEGWLYDGVIKPQVTIRKDVRSVTVDALKGFEAVVHLAELSNDPLGQNNPQITYQINHQGSVNLAQKCKRAGVQRFIYSSSCSVYGAGAEEYVTEESATLPQTVYACCKLLVEYALAGMADDSFSPTVLRNATAYGPSPRMRFDLVLNNLAGLAWTTKEIKMTSDGSPWRPLVHVLDICEAMARCLEVPRELIHNQIFNVGDTRQNYRVKEIAEIVAETFPGCKITLGQSDGDRRSYRVRFDKISARLPGFRCQRDARSGANELRQLFERTQLSHEVFVSRTFTRLKQLDYLVRTRQIDDSLFWQPTAA
jgi:nucleoside-diphosphate-sugar epimerase